jgi:hypothetical protein
VLVPGGLFVLPLEIPPVVLSVFSLELLPVVLSVLSLGQPVLQGMVPLLRCCGGG